MRNPLEHLEIRPQQKYILQLQRELLSESYSSLDQILRPLTTGGPSPVILWRLNLKCLKSFIL